MLDQGQKRCINVVQMFCVCWLTIKVGGDHVPLTLMFQELLSDHVHLSVLSVCYLKSIIMLFSKQVEGSSKYIFMFHLIRKCSH